MVNQITAIAITSIEPKVIVFKDTEIILVLEELKLVNHKTEDPTMSRMIVRKLYNITEFTEKYEDPYTDKLKNKYVGLEYSSESIYTEIIKHNLFYKLYDIKYIMPKEYFKDVVTLIKGDKKVGWFQQRNKIGYSIDFNRCIIENKKYLNKIKLELPEEISKHTLFHRIIWQYKHLPLIKNLECYNITQAINSLKNKDIDVLCISNLIVSLKEEGLCLIN